MCYAYILDTDDDDDGPVLLIETPGTKEFCKPSQIQHLCFVHFLIKPVETDESPTLGKWMVFKHLDVLDETWEKIRIAIARDELHGSLRARSSTARYDPTHGGPGPKLTGVICVYTKEHNMDAIGFKLIKIVRQDIKYKTEQDSMEGRFRHVGSGKVSIKTIFWNNGKPSFQCIDKPCYGVSYKREDI